MPRPLASTAWHQHWQHDVSAVAAMPGSAGSDSLSVPVRRGIEHYSCRIASALSTTVEEKKQRDASKSLLEMYTP